jgi:hypothetical protein
MVKFILLINANTLVPNIAPSLLSNIFHVASVHFAKLFTLSNENAIKIET